MFTISDISATSLLYWAVLDGLVAWSYFEYEQLFSTIAYTRWYLGCRQWKLKSFSLWHCQLKVTFGCPSKFLLLEPTGICHYTYGACLFNSLITVATILYHWTLLLSMLSQWQMEQVKEYCKRHKRLSEEFTLPRGSRRYNLFRHLIFDDERQFIFCFIPKVCAFLVWHCIAEVL